MSAERDSTKHMAVPLLATRFFLPQLPSTGVLRLRLIERLNQGLQCPLTLISAPPGFGKSSLLNQWVHSQESLKVGWLSLEPSDRDWSQFFRYLVAAWQCIYPQAGLEALAELNSSSTPNLEYLVNLLLNDLLARQDAAGAEHALLVLDDYHLIESSTIHEMVIYLVEHLPRGCHLALLTRADPPFPIARWRSRGWILEVRSAELRFTAAEANEYFMQRMHLRLTEEQVEVLQERTEGWIVGLQLAALSLQRRKDISDFVRDFGGSNRFVVDYLVEEVVHRQPEEIQQFLLTTALLDQFCGPLCDAMPGISSPYAQRMLERLEKANLFLIALDDRRYWFRYHHLFADLLRARVQQTVPEQIPVLYRSAAEWFAQHALWRDAIGYALKTKDFDFSANLFEQAILKGGLGFLYSGMGPLIEPFPITLVQNRPLLSLAKAVDIFESSQLEGIEALLRCAEKGLLASPPFPGRENALGWVYVVQSSVAGLLGDLSWMIEASQQVPLWIPDDRVANIEALLQVGNAYYYAGNLNQTDTYWQQALDLSLGSDNTDYILSILDGLGRLCYLKGELIRAEALFQRGLDLLAEHPGEYQRWLGATQRDYTDILSERNRLGDARALMVGALPLCEKWHTISGYGCGLIYMGRILLASGDISGANDMLNQADELRRTHTIYPDLETLAQVTRARLWLEEGKAEQAWQMLESCLQSACSKPEFQREWVLIAQARVLVHTNRPGEALTLLSGRLEGAKENGRGRNWLVMCLISALAFYASGDRQNALDVLGNGLVFAQEQDFRQIFVYEGEPMCTLLEDFKVEFPQSWLADYVSEVIAIFPAQPVRDRRNPLKIKGLYELLSRPELEILGLVCRGYSNQEIANRLVLSVGTVKFHVHHIYGKLDVRDRPQAIAKANQLGLSKKEPPGQVVNDR